VRSVSGEALLPSTFHFPAPSTLSCRDVADGGYRALMRLRHFCVSFSLRLHAAPPPAQPALVAAYGAAQCDARVRCAVRRHADEAQHARGAAAQVPGRRNACRATRGTGARMLQKKRFCCCRHGAAGGSAGTHAQQRRKYPALCLRAHMRACYGDADAAICPCCCNRGYARVAAAAGAAMICAALRAQASVKEARRGALLRD